MILVEGWKLTTNFIHAVCRFEPVPFDDEVEAAWRPGNSRQEVLP
jgi:hypothetical protein